MKIKGGIISLLALQAGLKLSLIKDNAPHFDFYKCNLIGVNEKLSQKHNS